MFPFPLPVAGALATVSTSDRVNCGQKVPANATAFHTLQLLTFAASPPSSARYIASKGTTTLGTWLIKISGTGLEINVFWNMVTTNLDYRTNSGALIGQTPMLIGISIDTSAGAGLKVQVFTAYLGDQFFKSHTFVVTSEGVGGSLTDDQDLTIGSLTGGASGFSEGATHHFFAYWEGAAGVEVFNDMLVDDHLVKRLANAAYWRPGYSGGLSVPDEGGIYSSHGLITGMEPQPLLIQDSYEDLVDDDEWALLVPVATGAALFDSSMQNPLYNTLLRM